MFSKRVKAVVTLLLCVGIIQAAMISVYASEDAGIIDGDKLNEMAESFLNERGINPESISIGFCYTATGDEWYYNGDVWFYPASMYKVPLMMQMAEKEAAGELKGDDFIYDKTFHEIEELILTYSNNEWAHTIREYLGGDEQWRQEAKKYTSLKENEYDEDYMQYCYFSNRYITQVMKTLYSAPQSFPYIVECLLKAMPERYFRLSLEGKYDVAQKYGSFEDAMGYFYNSTTGIIYTDNPCIVTVMTRNVDNYEEVIGDIALMLTEYSVSLDASVDDYEKEKEEARIAKETAERKAEEEKAERERQAQEAEQLKQQKAAEEKAAQEKQKKLKSIGVTAASIIAGASLIFVAIKFRLKKVKKHTVPQKRKAKSGYQPKH